MNYKNWTDEELIRQGKRLAVALPKAWQYLKTMPQNTPQQAAQFMRDMEAVQCGELTLKLLRDEYKHRKSNNLQA